MKIISRSISETSKASEVAKIRANKLAREQIISELPAELDENKFNDLVQKNSLNERLVNYIKGAYPNNILDENMKIRDLTRIQNILIEIKYGKILTTSNVREKFGSIKNSVKKQVEELPNGL